MKLTDLRMLAVVAVAMLCLSSAAQADVITADYADRHVLQGNFEAGTADVFLAGNSNGRRVGTGGGGTATRVNQPVIEFTLPTLTGTSDITSAVFTFQSDTPALNGTPAFDAVVSLMNYDATGDFSGADFTEDDGALGNGTQVGSNLASGSVSDGGTNSFTLSGASLTLLESFYTGFTPNQTSAFFRLSTSDTILTVGDEGANNNVRFNINTTGASGDPLVTSFSITTAAVPEPSSLAILGLAGIGMCVRRRRNK